MAIWWPSASDRLPLHVRYPIHPLRQLYDMQRQRFMRERAHASSQAPGSSE
jgi:hypothetical protein